MKAAIFTESLMPLSISTPLETSTAHGRTRRIASVDVCGVETAGQDHWQWQRRRNQRPVERLTGTSVVASDESVEQESNGVAKSGRVL